MILERTDLHGNPDQLAEAAREAIGDQVAYGMLDYRGILPLLPFGVLWAEKIEQYYESYSSQAKLEAESALTAICQVLQERILVLNEGGIEPVGLVPRQLPFGDAALSVTSAHLDTAYLGRRSSFRCLVRDACAARC